jgi:hypothetical protein
LDPGSGRILIIGEQIRSFKLVVDLDEGANVAARIDQPVSLMESREGADLGIVCIAEGDEAAFLPS